ncbi:hypothetical protein BGZ58_000683, partial [Dissophora ornata]
MTKRCVMSDETIDELAERSANVTTPESVLDVVNWMSPYMELVQKLCTVLVDLNADITATKQRHQRQDENVMEATQDILTSKDLPAQPDCADTVKIANTASTTNTVNTAPTTFGFVAPLVAGELQPLPLQQGQLEQQEEQCNQ